MQKKDGPYEPCHTSVKELIYGVQGPGDGLGYYAAYHAPENTFLSWEEAEKVARMMNIAFRCGQRDRSEAIKKLLE
jgi:hypothetical protein